MSTYPPIPQPWHDSVALIHECDCSEAYTSRGLVDSICWYHQTLETIEVLREHGWAVEDEIINTVQADTTFDDPDQGDQLYTLRTQTVPYPATYLIVPTEETK